MCLHRRLSGSRIAELGGDGFLRCQRALGFSLIFGDVSQRPL
jgi:hypothetical protein